MGHDRRLELHAILVEILGSELVYFQPPPNHKMQYPCIVYERDRPDVYPADNMAYCWTQGYQVTYIDQNPDGDVVDKLIELQFSSFTRRFPTSDLNHDVFVIYH